MSNLTKEALIAELKAALEKQTSKTVEIEQKGSWYKIDGGKSLRFSDLEQMHLEATQGQSVEAPAAKQDVAKKPAAKPAAKKAVAKKPAAKTANKSGGKTPKELWREKLANAGKNTLPRGF
ncbi:hypothetical protein Q4601_06315 [Shewanella sp. 1_MG-2023]|uniref:Uncharacterized protein n=1 Tax=Shewanella electrodiphila TaxID=934143 RepID=A0ABT0KMX8_9GAMM|nr:MULTISPECIES: hypothetical protein [Shewanella]MCC4833381.1 hypothetical protein [Shewanella sp. 10N.7]MCL1045193.1 hypothetical protein [Shewanella electrodiphila]MDO6611835.1 hypothetical protein [Shewanella sp. 7_MG-2023]MDO6771690.1 hypothetical protein [Shewanella sp. 2_MG-2023]MDO6793916.1 hypothetical protein [Shewanella sp. 1_MG-2023]